MPPSIDAPSRGITSQKSMSAQFVRAEKRPAGTFVWTDDPEQMWVLVEVMNQDKTILRVRRHPTGEQGEIDLGFGETYPHNPKVVADMTALHHIHEAGLLHNLGQRAQLGNQRPYTFMGTVLIAVNPLRRVADPPMDEYKDRPLNPETPHPYAIAELAYHQMRLGGGRKVANQSIIVSGESGAGKTESSKIILRFLTRRSEGGISGLEQKVLDSSPILESFGNAKTLRNDNSSRFGKFLKMQFTKGKYRLAGAFIETYLLEKSRVLSQGQGERNFHILFELVTGAAKSGLAGELKLGGPEAYRILSGSGCMTLDGVDDAAKFEGVRTACETIGMDEGTQMQVWKALAAVLHMSNVVFDAKDDEQGEVAAIRDTVGLATLGSLLGVEEGVLGLMLTQREVKTRGEVFKKKLGVQDANLTRDAIVKSIYEALFLWIVRVINASLGKGEESLPFIGVLDIFGFENFETKNEFEQLLINFTNESLQDTFNKQVFNNELKLYEEEGIDVAVSSCPDNEECLKMLTAKLTGVIPSLDSICEQPRPTDARYLEGVHKAHANHQNFPRTKPRDVRQCFWVKHYAGSVKYTVEGWVDRNMDSIPQSFGASLKTSTHKVVREMVGGYGVTAPAAGGGGARGGSGRSTTLLRPTVAKSFLKSMRELNATLLETTCNFVRCIKPNPEMECGVYDNKYVVEQLQCLGILQTCEVLKVGMPTRVTYTDLKEVLGDKAAEAEKLFRGEPETSLIASILWAFEVPSEAFRLGRTRVFFRAGQISTLQKILNETTPEKAPWIFKRLQEALASRQEAKAAAEEAQNALSKAESAVKKAEDAAERVIGASTDSDNSEDEGMLERPPRASRTSGVPEEDLRALESVARKARSAGSASPQIKEMVAAAREGKIGTHAEGAMGRVLAGSRDALLQINEAAAKSADLDAEIAEVRGRDEATALRRLSDMLRTLRSDFKAAEHRAGAAVEAAAKCQVDKTRDLTNLATKEAAAVESRAAAACEVADGAAQASKLQQAALEKAKRAAEIAAAAEEKARTAFSSFKTLLEAVDAEEEAARVKKIAAFDEENRRAAADREKAAAASAAEAAAAAASAAASPEASAAVVKTASVSSTAMEEGGGDDVSELVPSAAPVNRRASALLRVPSMSVKNILNSDVAKSPVPSPSPATEPPEMFGSDLHIDDGPGAPGSRHLQRSRTERFTEAMDDGFMQGHLVTQTGMMKHWHRRFFVLENGTLSHYEKMSLVGTKKNKTMKLTSQSVVRPANRPNHFGVRTGPVEWIMMAQTKKQMEDWIGAITDQILALFIREYDVPEDDYRSEGTWGQSFYVMSRGSAPQWVRSYPVLEAPRTGEVLFEGEVIEVTQVLTRDNVEFLRMEDERGWTFVNDVDAGGGGDPLFTKVSGELEQEKREHIVPKIATMPAVIFCGPSMDSQATGDVLMPGERVRVSQRFTASATGGKEKPGSFVKLRGKKRGWVPIQGKNKDTAGVVPFNPRR